MGVSLHIHGAAGTVTGSCFRLTTPNGDLLVDCGLFQGPKSVRALNYRSFPFDAPAIGAVLLTHAHIDHTGLFPKLALAGFRGKAWTTEPSRALLEWLLPDAGAIQEVEVERLNRRNSRRGEPHVAPIYARVDAEASLALLHVARYDKWFEPLKGVRARLRNAGHILGSAFIEMEIDAGPRPVLLVFSGDLGPREKALQLDPSTPNDCDILLLESTYGNRPRRHLTAAERRALLGRELTAGLTAGGNIIIPVFAVERTQEILDDIAALKREGLVAAAPVFLDSPLAGRITEVFRRHQASLEPAADGTVFDATGFRLTETVEQSKAIGRIHGGAIILAGSGMCDAGRVKHHLMNHLWRPDSTVLFVGYQAPGTLGAFIRDGTPRVRIHGEEVNVKARIRSIDAYSGHADRDELIAWAQGLLPTLGSAVLVHGEPDAALELADGLAAAGLDRERISVPTLDQSFDLSFRDGRWQAEPSQAVAPPRLTRSQATAPRDWHNDYAAALLDLREALRGENDDRKRQALLDEVRRLIASRSAGRRAVPPGGSAAQSLDLGQGSPAPGP
ncbi:MBL fold metallo-hydrolase RNA specificity domain-containing protein [Reyranella sp.]|uniref:MBL fold metallo-hydrolase RNA specificity domain-containing protein n=1 Tax=Reyranella sp. TaxID=1929291 RepID=UPI003BA92827